jgi:Fic family protein
MTEHLHQLFDRIDSLKKEIDALRPLSADVEGRVLQKFRLDWNFHSNAIEGNSLTYGETLAFLMEGLTAKGKPLKDHLDLRGHNEAILFLQDFIKKDVELTERDIRELHEMILVEPYSNPAQTPDGQMVQKMVNLGQYKTQPNHVKTASGETYYFASPEETPAKMHDLMLFFRENRDKMHSVEMAAKMHYDFVRIHPFDDGNGRISRLLMNFILMKAGFPPVVIKVENKFEYFEALQTADKFSLSVFIQFIGKNLIESLQFLLFEVKKDFNFEAKKQLATA